MHHRSDVEVGPDISGPTVGGTDNETTLQALRNLWPILSPYGRLQATNTAKYITSRQHGS